MTEPARTGDARAALEAVVRASRTRIVAALVGRSGRVDIALAEDAFGDAVAEALDAWARGGVPLNPAGWVAAAAARRLVDGQRRIRRGEDKARDLAGDHGPRTVHEPGTGSDEMVRDARMDFGSDDDTLRLVFTCCHPALAPESRVALTLNVVSGIGAGSCARAFLVDGEAMAKRIVRAKAKIRDAGIAFRLPVGSERDERLPDVLKTVELIFNEGYSAARGGTLDAPDLAEEGLRLARELARMLPESAEAGGLLALCLMTHARRAARVDAAGGLVRLPDQDRGLWDARLIKEGQVILARAAASPEAGRYVLRAALSAEHSMAKSAEATRWDRIVALYDALLGLEPSPVVELNRAVAIGESEGPEAMLDALAALGSGAERLHYAHVARGDALARLGRVAEAREAFHLALERAENEVERAHILGRVAALGA